MTLIMVCGCIYILTQCTAYLCYYRE